jgi:paxillin
MEGQDGKPYCAKCFKGSGVVCKACKKPVVSNNAVAALDGVFHKECFGCQACKKPFGPGFYNFEGLPYCEKHYLEKMGIPICGGCNQPITQGQFLTALNKKWHPEHFVCTFCMSPLKPDFKVRNYAPTTNHL